MNDHGISKENLLFTFPVGLRKSETISALGDVTAEALAERPREIDRLTLYSRINELPEDLLDILAYDFKVDWWDPNYTLEEKRRTLAGSWRVHKTLGTKSAVETAIRAIYPKAEVQEWFQYRGQPYRFKLLIDMTGENPDPARRDRVLARVNFYKNLRSHMDAMEYTLTSEPAALRLGGLTSLVVRLPIPEQADDLDFRGEAHIGGHLSSVVTIPIPEQPDSFDFRSGLTIGGAAGSAVKLPIPEQPDGFDFRDRLSLGGISGTAVKLPIPEQRDELNFRSEIRTGGRIAGSLTRLPIVERADDLNAKSTVGAGGKMALHVRLPTVQSYAAEPQEEGKS